MCVRKREPCDGNVWESDDLGTRARQKKKSVAHSLAHLTRVCLDILIGAKKNK